ncbi:MAG: hypothetical protein RIR11_3132 [Bacteroidota bacterium]|jgi:hypothetical protein
MNLRHLILACIATALTYPAWYPQFDISVDGSCAWLYNYLWVNDRAALAHIIFPHGALDFLQTPLPIGQNLAYALVFNALLRVLFAWTGLLLVADKGKKHYWIQVVLLVIWLKINMMDVLLFATVAHTVFLVNTTTQKMKWVWLTTAAVLTTIGLYTKTVIGLPAAMLFGMAIWLNFGITRQWLKFGLGVLAIPVAMVLGWLLFFGNLNGFGTMLLATVRLTLGNSAAVCHYPDNNIVLLGVFWFGWLVWPLFTKDRYTWWLLLLPVFAFWKYGISREDIWHIDASFRMYLWAFSVLLLLATNVRWYHFAVASAALLCFFFNLRNAEGWNPYEWRGTGWRNGLDWLLHFDEKQKNALEAGTKRLQPHVLPDSVRQIIGNGTVDVFPWHYSYAAANQLNLLPRHIPQSYAAYHPWLDQLDAQNDNPTPDFIIFHLKPYEESGQLMGIDDRYILQDAPQTLLHMVDNYKVRVRHPKFLLLEKTAGHHLGERKTMPFTAGWQDRLPAQNGIVYLKAKFDKTRSGRIKSLFYKDDPIMADLQFGSVTRRIKIVPALAATGFWIAPWLELPSSNNEPYRIPDDIRFFFPQGASWTMDSSLFQLEWIGVDTNSGWIPQRKPIPPSTTWQSNTEVAEVAAEGYSAGWTQRFEQSDRANRVFEASVRIKAPHNIGCCQLVLAVTDANGQTAHYATNEYCPMGIGTHDFWPVGLRTVLPTGIAAPFVVKVYVWNTGKKPILMRDLNGRYGM